MGSRQPAVLLRETVNVDQCGEERKERLSTGRYTLVDITCRGCSKKLGWHYLEAVNPVSRSTPIPTHTQADSGLMDTVYPWRCLDVTLSCVADILQLRRNHISIRVRMACLMKLKTATEFLQRVSHVGACMAMQSHRYNGWPLASEKDVAACHARHDTMQCAVCSYLA